MFIIKCDMRYTVRLISAWAGIFITFCSSSSADFDITHDKSKLRIMIDSDDKVVNSIKYSSCTDLAACLYDNHLIIIWDTTFQTIICKIDVKAKIIKSISFSPDGKTIASACIDGTVKIWDAATGIPNKILRSENVSASCAQFSHNGKIIACGLRNSDINLWDYENGTLIGKLIGHVEFVRDLVFTNDDKYIISIGENRIILWDIKLEIVRKVIELDNEISLLIASSSNSDYIAIATDTAKIYIYDIKTFEKLRTIFCTSQFTSLAIAPDRTTLGVASRNGVLTLWNMKSGSRIVSYDNDETHVSSTAIDFDPKGGTFATGYNGQLIIRDIDKSIKYMNRIGHIDKVLSIAYSPDGRILASSSLDCTIKIWDVKSNKVLQTFRGHDDWVYFLIFSHDGKYLASAGDSPFVIVWEVKTGNVIAKYSIDKNVRKYRAQYSVTDLKYDTSDESLFIISNGKSQALSQWNFYTSEVLYTKRVRDADKFRVLSYASDDHRILTTRFDDCICLMDLKSLSPIRFYRDGRPSILHAALSPDGGSIASVSDDQFLRVWNAKTGSIMRKLYLITRFPGSLVFSPDGKRLIVTLDEKICVYAFPSLNMLDSLSTSNEFFVPVFSPDGEYLAYGINNAVMIWRFKPKGLIILENNFLYKQ